MYRRRTARRQRHLYGRVGGVGATVVGQRSGHRRNIVRHRSDRRHSRSRSVFCDREGVGRDGALIARRIRDPGRDGVGAAVGQRAGLDVGVAIADVGAGQRVRVAKRTAGTAPVVELQCIAGEPLVGSVTFTVGSGSLVLPPFVSVPVTGATLSVTEVIVATAGAVVSSVTVKVLVETALRSEE